MRTRRPAHVSQALVQIHTGVHAPAETPTVREKAALSPVRSMR